MKNDINLLFKRKVKTYSNKNVAVLLLIAVIICAIAYAGISLPTGALKAAKKKAAEVQNQLSASAVDQKDVADKNELKAKLDIQLTELTALNDSKADILKYIEAIERSRPSRLIVINLNVNTPTTINLVCLTDSGDKTIALFLLRMREQNVFKEVSLVSSNFQYYTQDLVPITSCTITLTLPFTLDTETIIQELEQKDDVTSKTAAAKGGK